MKGRSQGKGSQRRGEDGALSLAFIGPARPGQGHPELDTYLDESKGEREMQEGEKIGEKKELLRSESHLLPGGPG